MFAPPKAAVYSFARRREQATYRVQKHPAALYEALEKPRSDLELAQPESTIEAMARQLTLDAAFGRTASQRLLVHSGRLLRYEWAVRPSPMAAACRPC